MSGPKIERAHETPFIRQFSIFLPNRVGQLSDLLKTLAEAQVDLAGLSVFDSSEWSVVRVIFTAPDKAREILRRHEIAFTECDALAVVLRVPETFHEVCETLVSAEMNIQFAYSLWIQREEGPVVVFHVDDYHLAVHLLIKHDFILLDHEDL